MFGREAAWWRGRNEQSRKCLVAKDSCKAGSLKIEGIKECCRVIGRKGSAYNGIRCTSCLLQQIALKLD